MTVKLTLTADDVTLATPVYPLGHLCGNLDHLDDGGHDEACGGQATTLGDLIARLIVAEHVTPAIAAEVEARTAQVTEDEIRRWARDRIRDLAAEDAAEAGWSQLTLAAAIDAEITRQFHATGGTAMTRGQPSTIIAAVVAAEVTARLRDMAAELTAQVIDRVRQEIAAAPVPVIER